MDTSISRAEHEEFKLRLEEKNKRQDKRIELLEESTRRIELLTTSVEKLAMNMENMLKEQEQQGALESRDGEKWRQVSGYCLTLIVGAAVGFVLTHIGI
ncbi:MAG: hypothetical protein HFE90_03790 [Firmicutes bacterium]|nr:hypothetical protein [Bacillota bacterium]